MSGIELVIGCIVLFIVKLAVGIVTFSVAFGFVVLCVVGIRWTIRRIKSETPEK